MITVTRIFPLSLLCCLAAGASADNFMQQVNFIGGAALGYTNLSFPAKLDQDMSFVSANLTAAATYKRWQLSLNSAFNLQDADISEEEDTGEGSRKDLDLTLGYQLNDHWGFFGGYKQGETEMDFVSREEDDDGKFNRVEESYEQEGPFLGVSFSWRFDKAGRLSISAAYADLRATNHFGANTDEEEEDDEAPEFDDLTGTVRGDTTGISYGITWTMPLSTRLLFQTRVKINDYEQDIRYEGVTYKGIDETLSSLHVGLAYVL